MSIRDVAARDEDSALWTLEEIGRLVSASGNAAETLNNIVHLIQRRFETDVCSVYLLEPDRANLVLAATVGLRAESVGRVRMRLTEGLAGLVAERLRPQFVADAATHPRFKYFPEAGEDPYRSFLGVPIVERGLLQGVLVVQTIETRTFGAEDMRLLTMAGAQLAPIVAEARTLGQFVAPAHQRLGALAQNLWWSWDPDTTSLFREIDPVLWRTLDNNPVALLQQIPIDKLEERASQLALHSRINYAYRRLQEYLNSKHTWGARHAGVLWARPVAYFSAEFGIHESLPIYSGGLGILAGDHIKSASDLGIPLVGIGLYYDQGYFRQRLDRDGWQHEDYIDVDHRSLPMRPALSQGVPVTISVETRTGSISARVWQLSIGRNTLLLLDSNVEGNQPEDRELTSRLYGGDDRVRIRQELLLGVGGVRALAALGIAPGVLHLNEGHSAFAPLEVVRQRMVVEGVDAWEALRRVAAQVVFTTHTPVPAGHDRFSRRARRRAPRPAARIARRRSRTLPRPRPRQPARRQRDLLHDGPRAQVVPPRQRGLLAARPGLARDVEPALSRSQRGSRADRPHHQRRARADLARAADAPGVRPASRARLDDASERRIALGSHRRHRRRRAVGNAPDVEGAAHRHRAPPHRPAGGAPRRAGGDRRPACGGR